ncbi:nuclear transport factor 2 family protein [Muricoccus radiodurans]|uniref:nuclear transport factor 2 family protein n=1 Tax=Muricoccus radiodurans TaxID=2231721 RepID=UPI003CF96BEE
MSDTEAAGNVALLQGLYAEYAAGNRAPFFNAMAEDLTFISAGGGGLPWSGTWHGTAGVGTYFSRLDETVQVRSYTVEHVIAQGEWVVALAKLRLAFHGSDREFELEKADFHRLRDGKLVEFREFYDSAFVCACRDGG